MSRPPIIISNGGLAGELAKGLATGTSGKIKKNVDELNEDTYKENKGRKASASWICCADPKVPKIIWHLKGENLEKFFKENYPDVEYMLEEFK